MARPNKFNLQYFPLEIQMFDDHKLVSIEEVSGMKGGYIALRIMAMVYADNGYYLEWPDKFEYTVAKRVGNGCTSALVIDVFKLCLKHDLFNKEKFEKHKIVTSRGIQKRWAKVMKDMGRKIVVDSNYWINPQETGINNQETGVSSQETGVSHQLSTQKETKLNEKKVKDTTPGALGVGSDFIINLVKELFSEQFFPTWEKWKSYKVKQWKFKYKADETEEGALRKLHMLSEGKEAAAGAILQESIDQGWKGFFPKDESKTVSKPGSQPPPAPTFIDPGKKHKSEINYLYGRYLEDQCTIITVDTYHYNFLKTSGMTNFSADVVAAVKQQALNYMKEKSIDINENSELNIMKRFGVLQVFKEAKEQQLPSIFNGT